MNVNEMEAKIKELEGRIADLPDWKKKYEAEHAQIVDIRSAIATFLGYPLVKEQYDKPQIGLEHQQTVVTITHEEKPVAMTTSTVVGKVLFIALTELKEGFTSVELMAHLAEHGWNIIPNTISPTVGKMVRDGTLVRIDDSKPTRFRTPIKVVFNVKKEG